MAIATRTIAFVIRIMNDPPSLELGHKSKTIRHRANANIVACGVRTGAGLPPGPSLPSSPLYGKRAHRLDEEVSRSCHRGQVVKREPRKNVPTREDVLPDLSR